MSGVSLRSVAAADVPTPAAGRKILFVDTATGEPSYKDDAGVVVSLQGATGAAGPAGPAGADGAVWRSGTGAPADVLGVNGDWYIDTASGDAYYKAAGTYTLQLSLVGPAGPAGADGADGATGPAGADGPSAYDVAVAEGFVGDEAAWLASLVGPTGPAGADGDDGATGPPGADGMDGSTWREGTGVPSNALGVDGDFYLDDASGDVYQKAAGVYAVVANIKGPDGPTGPAGADGGSVDLGSNLLALTRPNTGATGPLSFGYSHGNTGTITHPTITSSNAYMSNRRTVWTSATASGSFAGYLSNDALVTRGSVADVGGFKYQVIFGIEAVLLSTARCFFGLTSSAASYTVTDPSVSGDIIGIGADAADSDLTLITRNNVTTTKTPLTTPIAKTVAAQTLILVLTISCTPNASDMHVRLEDLLTGTVYYDADISTTLPRDTAVMRIILSVNTGTAVHNPAPALAKFGDVLTRS
jgi:hypothetical protein